MRVSKLLDNKRKIIITVLIILFCIIFIIINYILENNKNNELITDEEVILKTNEEEKINIENDKKILVHVDGAVNCPGLVELKENSRISDAIEKAGGITEEGNLKNINLAYFLEDGMKIFIPTNNIEKGENEMDNNTELDKNNENVLEDLEYVTQESSNVSLDAFNTEKNNNKKTNKKININTANETELSTLPGIGEATALKIINYRNENGKFNYIEDLKNVKGIGENKFDNIKDFIICK